MPKRMLQLLGPVQVVAHGDEPPRFRSQRTMALLGYLAAEHRAVARDALISLFWTDETPSRAKANLRRELHNLGNILPGCWDNDRRQIHFLPGDETRVDIYELPRLAEEERWTEAAESIGGNFLEGVALESNLAFETWLLGERERWRQRAEGVLEQAVEAQLKAGDQKRALRFARRLLHLLPWHEEMHRQVMVLLARQGRRSAALQQFETCRQILRQELDVDVTAETRELYERLRDPRPSVSHNIPAALEPLIGREEELAFLQQWLAGDAGRLLTIAGAGGMGKTRLALALARQLLEQPLHPFADGIYFVSLAEIDEPAKIVWEIAAALDFSLQSRDERSYRRQLLDYLAQKQMLVLLDNFEHLLSGADFLTALLRAAPGVQIMVTSRERLNLRGEQLLPLEGLDYGNGLHDQGQVPRTAAAELFLHVARRQTPAVQLDEANRQALDRICQRLEGTPLALELAATWAGTLSLPAIQQEIEGGLDLLRDERGGVPVRHRSMRAVFDGSWRRLSVDEQRVLAMLAVFRGGFTQEAAAAVTGASLERLSRLVNSSLVGYQREGRRYEIHELLRQYAGDQLADDLAAETQRRHLRYYLGFAERVQAWQMSEEPPSNVRRLERELGNFRVALGWSLNDAASASQGLELVGELGWFWKLGARDAEGYEWLQKLLSCTGEDTTPEAQAQATLLLGEMELIRNDNKKQAEQLLRRGLAIYERLDHKEGCSRAMHNLGRLARLSGNHEQASAHFHAARQLAKHRDGKWTPDNLTVFAGLGMTVADDGNLSAARAYYEEGLALAVKLDVTIAESTILSLLGELALREQKWAEARSYLRKAIRIRRAMDYKSGVARGYWNLGNIARCEGHYELAIQQYQRSLARLRNLGRPAFWWSVILPDLGHAYLLLGDTERAQEQYKAALEVGQEIAYELLVCLSLIGFGHLAAVQEDPRRAARLWGASEAQIEALGQRLRPPDQFTRDHFLAMARQQCDKDAFEREWAAGRAMSLSEAAEHALKPGTDAADLPDF